MTNSLPVICGGEIVGEFRVVPQFATNLWRCWSFAISPVGELASNRIRNSYEFEHQKLGDRLGYLLRCHLNICAIGTVVQLAPEKKERPRAGHGRDDHIDKMNLSQTSTVGALLAIPIRSLGRSLWRRHLTLAARAKPMASAPDPWKALWQLPGNGDQP